jgi:DNA-binding beta-propeller fold protein YncE
MSCVNKVMVACLGMLLSVFWATALAEDAPLPLRLIADVPTRPAGAAFAGLMPRMDYESIDPVRRMLYIAYMGANEVVAFDLDTNKVTAHIQDLQDAHGTLAIPELKRLYVSATGTGEVAVIDERSLAITSRTDGGDYPDGIAYDPADHRIFVSDERGGTDTVIDVNTNKTVDTIQLGGEAGNTQYDPLSHQVYSDVQSRDDVAVVDPKTDKIVARHRLPGCAHDHGLQLDVRRRLAFITCDGNAKLLLVDLKNWAVLSTYDVGDDPDVLAFDGGLGCLYVASESGVVAVFEERGRSLTLLGKAFLADNAHTVAVDPKTHRVYFALKNVNGKPVIRVMAPSI